MEHLWTPWRSQYVTGPKVEGCVFCTIAVQDDDRRSYVLYRGAYCFVLLNLYPYNTGHLMVTPYAHVARLDQLAPGVAAELMYLSQHSLGALERALHPDGFNLGMNLGKIAGAGVESHVHQHIVPRWAGDTNFMPVVGQTKVMPESLEQTFDKVLAAWNEG